MSVRAGLSRRGSPAADTVRVVMAAGRGAGVVEVVHGVLFPSQVPQIAAGLLMQQVRHRPERVGGEVEELFEEVGVVASEPWGGATAHPSVPFCHFRGRIGHPVATG